MGSAPSKAPVGGLDRPAEHRLEVVRGDGGVGGEEGEGGGQVRLDHPDALGGAGDGDGSAGNLEPDARLLRAGVGSHDGLGEGGVGAG